MLNPSENAQDGLRLLVMLPALNEEATIADVLSRIPRSLERISSIDVLVVDDGSTDRTAELARKMGATVISHTVNRGLGVAIQTGLAEAIRRQVDIAVNMDSDGQFDPACIRELIEPVLQGRADMATASRFKDGTLVPQMPLTKRLGNWGMSKLVSFLTGGSYADVSCGFRAYSREALLRLVLTGSFTYTQESFVMLAARGMKIVEVPVPVRGVREHGQSRVASNLITYALRTSAIIYGSVRDCRPGAVFGGAAFVLVFLSLCTGGFFIWHRIVTGIFTPHIWAGFVSAFLFSLGVLLFALGQVALMISRLRVIQEQQLYMLRRFDGALSSALARTAGVDAARTLLRTSAAMPPSAADAVVIPDNRAPNPRSLG